MCEHRPLRQPNPLVKVLFVTSAYPGGPDDARGVFIHQLARALVAEGADVRVLAPAAAPTGEEALLDGVRVHRVAYWRLPTPTLSGDFGGIVPGLRRRPWLAVQIPPLVLGLRHHAIQLAHDRDIIHGHWLYPGGLAGAFAASRLHRPLVVTAHGTDLALAGRFPPLRWVSRRVCRSANACIGVSASATDQLRALGAPAGRLHFIPLGVEPPAAPLTRPEGEAYAEFARHDGLRVLYVGRLIPGKSVDTLLHAQAELQRRGRQIVSALVGSGPAEEKLRGLARRLDLRDALFAGQQSPASVGGWMSSAHVLVLPSLAEGRGLVIVEAMAHGLPVIASDIPGPRELVRHGETGYLFKPRDPVGLARLLERLIEDGAERARLGAAGRLELEAQGLTTRRSAERHLALYGSLLGA